MKTLDDLLPHLNKTHEGILSLHHLMFHLLKPKKREFYRTIAQLSPTNQNATETVTIPFNAQYVCAINETSTTIYIAEGQVSTLPPDAIPIPAGGYLSFEIEDTNVITVFQAGTPTGTTTVILQFSNHPITMSKG